MKSNEHKSKSITPESAMKLLIGLGNPGAKYTFSRHNIGLRCIDSVSKFTGISLSEKNRLASIGRGKINGIDVILAKSQSYMNNSGESINYISKKLGIKPKDIIVVYDDMDLPVGNIRIRPFGSSGGHNGLQSIIDSLGTPQIARIRIGIDRPLSSNKDISHVLGNFTESEEKLIETILATVNQAFLDIVNNGLQWAMNNHN